MPPPIIRPFFPNLCELHEWVRVNRPDLHQRIGNGTPLFALCVLNEETGLNISSNTCAEDGAAKFLAALKLKQQSTASQQ